MADEVRNGVPFDGAQGTPSKSRGVQGGLTEEEKRSNVIRLAFGGSPERFEEFCRTVRQDIPDGTAVVLRGSAVTGQRWKDGAPFDADGPGTSDLDLTLVGDEAVALFKLTGFFVPGVHSRPVSEDDPDIAPSLIPLRETLMAMTGRPVRIRWLYSLTISGRRNSQALRMWWAARCW